MQEEEEEEMKKEMEREEEEEEEGNGGMRNTFQRQIYCLFFLCEAGDGAKRNSAIRKRQSTTKQRQHKTAI